VEGADSGRGHAAELMKKKMMATMFAYYDERMTAPLRDLMLKEDPDMILADFITPCAWELAEEFGIPVVINVPGPLSFVSIFTHRLALSAALGACREVSLAEGLAHYNILERMRPIFTSKPCLVNSFIGLDKSQRMPSNLILTGPTAPRVAAEGSSLTSSEAFNDWLAWVRSEGLKVVYVTMGSMQKLESFQVKALYEGLARLKCAVAWSLKEDQQCFLPTGADPTTGAVDGLPRRFYIQSWMPQNEALQLPDVALVITHCGFGGLNESITAGKPIVATPFRVDQPMNAALVKERGMAEVLDTATLSAASVEAAVAKVLENESYAKAAKEMQRLLFKTGGAETCVEAVELLAKSGEQKIAPKLSAAPQPKLPMLMPLLLGVGLLVFSCRSK